MLYVLGRDVETQLFLHVPSNHSTQGKKKHLISEVHLVSADRHQRTYINHFQRLYSWMYMLTTQLL